MPPPPWLRPSLAAREPWNTLVSAWLETLGQRDAIDCLRVAVHDEGFLENVSWGIWFCFRVMALLSQRARVAALQLLSSSLPVCLPQIAQHVSYHASELSTSARSPLLRACTIIARCAGSQTVRDDAQSRMSKLQLKSSIRILNPKPETLNPKP